MSITDISKLRRSAAHLLVMAVAELYKTAKFGSFGLTDTGFYYDIEFDEPISLEELSPLQSKMLELSQSNLKFVTQTKTKEDAVSYFTEQEQPYKRELIEDMDVKKVELVELGNNAFVDIKNGEILDSSEALSNVALLDVSGAYWKGDDKRPMLTRITGACFSTPAELEAYKEFLAEMLRRDHRVMGKKLGFFSVDPEVGTGLIFWNPRGRYVRDAIAGMIKAKMQSLGFEMVETPLLAQSDRVSLMTQPQTEQLVAKNLNENTDRWYIVRQQVVDAHLRMFSWKERSYRELPWKVGEIGKLVRYEKVSELEGLHRAREFTQDTMTVVCAREQVEKEIETQLLAIVQFTKDLGLSDFGVQYRFPLATTKAQQSDQTFLATILKNISKKQPFSLIEEPPEKKITEPEIVLTVKDSMKQRRRWSKIQILFNLPLEHQLTYMGNDGVEHTPVVIRSTLSGSLERVIATLIEHYAGVLPLWLTYEHARVIPVTSKQEVYADKLMKHLNERGIRSTIDSDSEPLEGKIKQAEEEKIPYMLIVGEKEQATNTVSVRVQGHGDVGLLDIESFIKDIQAEVMSKSIKSSLV